MNSSFGTERNTITIILMIVFLSMLFSSLFLLISSIIQRRKFTKESLPSLEDIMGSSKVTDGLNDTTFENNEKSQESSLFDIDSIGERERAIDPMFSEISGSSRVNNRKNFFKKNKKDH